MDCGPIDGVRPPCKLNVQQGDELAFRIHGYPCYCLPPLLEYYHFSIHFFFFRPFPFLLHSFSLLCGITHPIGSHKVQYNTVYSHGT
jgi:hypothetical protein